MFPKLLQRLFANEGAGPKLRTDILPLDNKTLGVNGEGAVAVQLSDAVDSASSTTAASSNAVKTVWDKANSAAASANAAQSAATDAKATADTAQDTADAAKTAAAAAQEKANSAYTEATKTASTSAAGRVQLSDAVNSASSTTAASSKAVKTAYDAGVAAAATANAAKTTATSAQTKANSAYTEATKAASTSAAGRVQLSDAVDGTRTTVAATENAVKKAWDKALAASSATGKAYIVESWKSGTSWYRVWSDGFIEQGFITPKLTQTGGGSTGEKVTLVKPFTTTNYGVVDACCTTVADGLGIGGGITVRSKATTYFLASTYGVHGYYYVVAFGY